MYETASVAVSSSKARSGTRLISRKVSIERGVMQGNVLSPLYFIVALDRIFRRHIPRAAGISLTSALWIGKLECADEVALLDENGEATQERLSVLSPGANSEGRINVVLYKSFAQYIEKAQKITRTTEEDVKKIDFKLQYPSERNFLYEVR